MVKLKTQTPIEKTYDEVHKLIIKVANKNAAVHHIDREMAMSLAAMGFMKAYSKYDESCGTEFTTYLYTTVKGEIRNYVAKQRKEFEKTRNAYEHKKYNNQQRRFHYDLFMLESGEDAKKLVQLVIKPDVETKQILDEQKIRRNTSPGKILAKLNRKLKWDTDRLINAYKEVWEYMNG